ncbi:protocadherin gamma-A10-like isoform X2 [Channa argus]|uniref:protocadherin gamma-A10-like isoform X2 n=1 Tax=Channa argus TaxID=215402 RepID=UPI00352284A2
MDLKEDYIQNTCMVNTVSEIGPLDAYAVLFYWEDMDYVSKSASLDCRVSILLFCVVATVSGQIRYSIPEEMRKGLFVGDVAKDLGLDVKRLISGRARLVIDGDYKYVELNDNKGHIVVNERIDREKLCAKKSPCSFSLEIVLEDPLELFSITIEIQDVNDHAPAFPKKEINLEISESTPTGTVFLLDSAADPDVGINSLQSYLLKTNDHFVLKQHTRDDGSKYAEMMLQSSLDREKQSEHTLILTAVDGGEPQRSGTVKIHVSVLDANDNAPLFTQSLYKASVLENVLRGTVIARVSAIDADQGYNGNVTYSFTHLGEDSSCAFEINSYTGEVKLTGEIDYEVSPNYEINIQAKDPWGVVGASKLIIEIADVNDNSPVITMASYSGKISEDSTLGTVVALISVQDKDSGKNGQVHLNIDENLPFKIKSSLRNYYTLVTDQNLDRERRPKYSITLTATDEGSPALSSSKSVILDVTDVNDNAPVFNQTVYMAQVKENNSPGVALLQIHATDPDQGQNARISYFIIDSDVNGNPASTYFSVNTESGVIQSLRSLDYEQVKEYKITIKAQDGGSPPLTSNITVIVRVQDQNDNPPQVLYPVQTGGSQVAEMVPRSADVGYLVTKVVAVDVDSGQNAWLSYKLQKATDRALFEVGLQNGEIRTIRQVTDKDAVKQRLTVIVEDNGQPSRSATVIVNLAVAVADSFPEVLSEFTDFANDKEYNDNLTVYLVLALAVVSFLFITCLVVIISVKVYRWRQSRVLYHSSLPVIPYYPPRYSDTLGTGTLQHVYNYEVCRTTDSRKSDCKLGRAGSQNVLIMDPSSSGTMQRKQSEKSILDEPDSPLEQKPPNNDWRFTQGQRPGPSGPHMPYGTHIRWTPKNGTRATGGPEVAMGTGPWPQPPTEAEQLQALMAAANVSEATATLGPGTMGLSTRYSPQFTLQHVPDYRQNVYIPGSTATLTSNPQQQATAQQATQQALPPPQASTQPEPPKAAQTPASKKKSTKKEKK